MDNFEDILIFIGLILFSLISMFSKKRREKKQGEIKKAEGGNVAGAEDDIFDWGQLKEIITASAGPSTAQKSEHRFSSPEVQSYETASDYSDLRVKKRVSGSMIKSKSSFFYFTFSIEEEINDITFNISFDSQEDVQRAFVYSEIFNRKYD